MEDPQMEKLTGQTKKEKCVFDMHVSSSEQPMRKNALYVIVEDCADLDDDTRDEDSDDVARSKKRQKDIRKWSLCELPKMIPRKALLLDVAMGSRAYVCAKDWVVVVDSLTWEVFLVDLVAGEYTCLPKLNPNKYFKLPSPTGERYLDPDSLSPNDQRYYWRCGCLCCTWCYSFEDCYTRVKGFINKFVKSLDDGGPSILVAMLNPQVCFHCDGNWGDRVLAYCNLDEKVEHDICWTPVFVFPPQWVDGVFQNSNFLLLTGPAPYVLQTFSFKSIGCRGQPTLLAKVSLQTTAMRSLDCYYYIKQLASMDGKLYLVCCYCNGCDFGFHPNVQLPDKDPVIVFHLSYPDPVVKQELTTTNLGAPDSECVVNLEPTTDLGSKESDCVVNLETSTLDGKESDCVVNVETPSTNLVSEDPDVIANMEPTTDLGGKALFVGDISAFSIEGEVEGAGFVRPNTVYFTPHDDVYGEPKFPHVMPPLGFFDLDSNVTEVLKWDHKAYPGKIPLFV